MQFENKMECEKIDYENKYQIPVQRNDLNISSCDNGFIVTEVNNSPGKSECLVFSYFEDMSKFILDYYSTQKHA